ncbi:MAG: flagellar hook-associated protein FlgK [Candidatus Kapaibacteriales bacterium]
MGVSPSLEIAKRALIAQKLGLDTTSGNIANVNTPGYSRRVPNLTEGEPLPGSNGFVGNGVLVSKLRTFREEFFDRQIRRGYSNLVSLEMDNTLVQRLSAILGEPSENSLTGIITDFFNSFEDLTQHPEDVSLRQRTITIAQTLLARFKNVADSLSETRIQIKNDIVSNVQNVNQLIREIADLNYKIASNKSKIDGESQSYVDQRAQKLEELSKLLDINVTNGDFGTINVFVNGLNLVTGVDFMQLKVKETVHPITQEKTISIVKTDQQMRELATLNIQNGKLNSLLKNYNITLDPNDSSNQFSLAKDLENFFRSFVQKINSLTSQGYGLTDSGPNPPGRLFFVSTGNFVISDTNVNSELIVDPRKLPIASLPDESGNTEIAKQISDLRYDTTLFNGLTPNEALSNIISKVGNWGNSVSNLYSNSKLAVEQLVNQRDSIIGVNLDEEAINLVKFQKAFEAVSRLVSTTNDLLATIVNLGR